jgi:hypothetical protein
MKKFKKENSLENLPRELSSKSLIASIDSVSKNLSRISSSRHEVSLFIYFYYF